MKKRIFMASIRTKKNTDRSLTRQGTGISLCKRKRTATGFSSVTVHVSVVHHPVLQGIGSLGNVSGGYVRFENYMRGNYVRDMRRAWERVGECLNESLNNIR